MDTVPAYRGVEVFALEGFPRAVELDADGLHHPRSARSRARIFTPYAEFTHVGSSPRTLWLGARRSAYLLPRRAFVDPNGPENLVRALVTRIAQSPGGAEQLARMAQIEESARAASPLRAVWGLVIACVLVFGFQLALGFGVREVGYFSPALFLDGDLWRIVTANLIHALPQFPLHLVLNMIGLVAFGFLVERPLGTARTLIVMGAAALGSMAFSGFVEPQPVVGASGIAFGLLGSAFCLELRRAEELPAWWRLPRRLFYALLAINAALPVLLPIIAWAAHLGGFAAGFATTALLAGRGLTRPTRTPSWIRVSAALFVAIGALSVASAGRALLGADDFLAEHAARLGELPGISPGELNNYAWYIAISPDRTKAQIGAALVLAERAVAETGRSQPELLDTLAEVQFQLGWADQAVVTIDEAIDKAPNDPYYREQRRRFLGERAADDRPPSPSPRPGGEAEPRATESDLTV